MGPLGLPKKGLEDDAAENTKISNRIASEVDGWGERGAYSCLLETNLVLRLDSLLSPAAEWELESSLSKERLSFGSDVRHGPANWRLQSMRRVHLPGTWEPRGPRRLHLPANWSVSCKDCEGHHYGGIQRCECLAYCRGPSLLNPEDGVATGNGQVRLLLFVLKECRGTGSA